MTIGHFLFAVAALVVGLLVGFVYGRRSLRARLDAVESKADKIAAKLLETAKRPRWLGNSAPQPGTAGFTIVAALNGVGCLGRSRADEPVFVLCARDKTASMLVRDWAKIVEAMSGGTTPTVIEARALADRMERWREANGGGKVPD